MGSLKAGLDAALTLHLPALMGYAKALTKNTETAEELLQDTCMLALKGQHTLESGSDLKAWLFTVMRNRFFNNLRSLRRRRKRPHVALDDMSELEESMHAIDAVRTIEHRESLRALLKLAPKRRQALLLAALGFEYRTIARCAGDKEAAIPGRLHRARKTLEHSLDTS